MRDVLTSQREHPASYFFIYLFFIFFIPNDTFQTYSTPHSALGTLCFLYEAGVLKTNESQHHDTY